jgi:hypothetical protein
MAVESVAAARVESHSRPFPLAISAPMALGGLVAVSAIVRFLLALSHPTPLLFADEYIYSTLAHGIATTGHPTIRGEAVSFPALLEPILTAPFWLFGDAGVALRLTQALNAVAMSLAAVPVYLLARKLGLGAFYGLAASALALLTPAFFYVAYVVGEPIAYPLVLAAVYAGVCALSQPTRTNQLAFMALAGLASFARIQFVILPLAFLGAALLARPGFRRLRLSLGLVALAGAAFAVHGLGYYHGVRDLPVDPGKLLHWAALDSMLLAYAAGWLIIPGALVALATPRTPVERAFAGMTIFLALGLFGEAALYASSADGDGAGGRFQERYLFTLLPLLALAFGLSLRRGGRARLVVLVLSTTLVAVSARFPLSAWTDDHGREESPLLMGVYRLEAAVGYANGSLLVAVVVAVLAAGAAAVAYRTRLWPAALGVVALLLASVGAGAWALDAKYAQRARATYFPPDARWVDHAKLGDVTVVNTPAASRELVLEQMFWNRSIKRLVRLRQADSPDVFSAPQLTIRGDGALLLHGRPLRTALLMNEYAVTAELEGAKSVASSQLFELWKPVGTPRLRLLVGGRFFDGWLADSGYARTWGAASTLRLRVSLPRTAPGAARIVFTSRRLRRIVTIRPGATRAVRFEVPEGVWTLRWKAPLNFLPDGRPVSVHADRLELEPLQPAAAGADI